MAVLKIHYGYRHLIGCVRHTPTTTKNSKKNWNVEIWKWFLHRKKLEVVNTYINKFNIQYIYKEMDLKKYS